MKIFLLISFLFIVFSCSKVDKADFNLYQKRLTDIENNDDKNSACLTTTQNCIVGFFNNKLSIGDKDFYNISVTQKNSSYKMILTSVPGIDSKIAVYTSQGEILFYVDENGRGEGEKLWEYYPNGDIISLSVEAKTDYNETVPYYLNFEAKGKDSVEEIEPNNDESNAIKIDIEDDKLGLISPKNDFDYYKIQLTDGPNSDFEIRLETISKLDLNMTIYDKDNAIQKFVNTNSWGGAEIFSFLSSKSKVYYIRVGGSIDKYDKMDPRYTLSVKKLKPVFFHEAESFYEREFNDNIGLATDMINATEYIGSFFPEEDVDWYKFDVLKNENMVNISLSGIRGLDLVIEIFDKNSSLVKKIDENNIDYGEDFSTNNLKSGRYFIKIYSKMSRSMINYNLYYNVRYKK